MENYNLLSARLSEIQARLLSIQKRIDDDFYNRANPLDIRIRGNSESSLYTAQDERYQIWLNRNRPSKRELAEQKRSSKELPYTPTISLIFPTFNTPLNYLTQAIESVLNQTYSRWELCIADDCSDKEGIKLTLLKYKKADKRIKVVFREENGHISNASNSALTLATGDFVGLLDHDDLLTPDALYEVVLLLNQHRDADMIYSDEDKINDQNMLSSPFFKPGWSPDSFLSRMYTCHFGVYRRSLVEQIGGFREGYEGAQDYDLVLRITELTEKIHHIPKVLYHWRMHPNSTASSIDSKNYATEAAQKALERALIRRKESGCVIPIGGGHYIVRYDIKEQKKVTIIIPTRDFGSTLNICLISIFEKTLYNNYEVLVIDNGSQEKEALDVINFWTKEQPDKFHCKRLDIPFNYSKINNYAVKNSSSEYLLFLNNDVEVITSGWLTAMVEQAQRSTIAAVGAKLLYPDDTVQHAGVICVTGVAGHGHKHFKDTDPGYFNQLQTVNNYSAVTAACLLCQRAIFEAAGGFNEELQVAFNDVDLCFKFLELGYRNVCLPHVRLYHYESKSRGYDTTPEKKKRFEAEIRYMRKHWIKIIENDNYYNCNLSPDKYDYSINV